VIEKATSAFQSPSISLPFLDNFVCFCGNGMIESMLEPHLKEEAGASQVCIPFVVVVAVAIAVVVVVVDVVAVAIAGRSQPGVHSFCCC
jgi:hypothetical protein